MKCLLFLAGILKEFLILIGQKDAFSIRAGTCYGCKANCRFILIHSFFYILAGTSHTLIFKMCIVVDVNYSAYLAFMELASTLKQSEVFRHGKVFMTEGFAVSL